MLACDPRIGCDVPARLGLTEVTAGIPYPAAAMEIVRAEPEPGLARRLVLSGQEISPLSARELGILDELVDPARLLERSIDRARTLAGARSYARVKEQLRGATLARMREIVASGADPLMRRWL